MNQLMCGIINTRKRSAGIDIRRLYSQGVLVKPIAPAFSTRVNVRGASPAFFAFASAGSPSVPRNPAIAKLLPKSETCVAQSAPVYSCFPGQAYFDLHGRGEMRENACDRAARRLDNAGHSNAGRRT